MGFNLRWLFSRKKDKGPKSVNIFVGAFFMVNYCLGTGFLGVPFSFFYSGYLAAIPTLLLIAFVSWNNAEWTVETMARAQAVELWEKDHKEATVRSSDSEGEREALLSSSTKSTTTTTSMEGDITTHPNYNIRLTRKFEPSELCDIFLTRWGKYTYILILTVYSFLALWSFTTVAGSAWATNLPFNTSSLQRCDSDQFLHVLIPSQESCHNVYMLCLLFFAAITIPLSLLDLKEQAIIQLLLGLLRFATIASIVLYALVNLAEGGNECTFTVDSTNMTNLSDTKYSYVGSGNRWNKTYTGFKDLSKIVFRFDAVSWLVSIPVFTYAYIMHQGVPALTHPIREKKWLRHLMAMMFIMMTLSYLSMGIVVPLWFKANIQETCTLNWVKTAKSGSTAIRILSYYLVIFPSIDVTSAYPLVVHTIANNIYTVLLSRDTTKKSKRPKLDFFLQLIIKLICAVLPIVAALFISNLVYVLKYAGIMGFFISFFFPTALQFCSIWKCSSIFSSEGASGINQSPSIDSKTRTYNMQNSSIMCDNENFSGSSFKTRLMKLFTNYRTPYSNRVLSHPIMVLIIGVVGVILFLLAIASLAQHPSQIHCDTDF